MKILKFEKNYFLKRLDSGNLLLYKKNNPKKYFAEFLGTDDIDLVKNVIESHYGIKCLSK